jgi:hypothetical protein
MKKNCWEVMNCGREPEGVNRHLGTCPAAKEDRLDGIHGGIRAGRACWVVAGTLCGNEVQGSFAKKCENCGECAFYQQVRQEEKGRYVLSIELVSKLRPAA